MPTTTKTEYLTSRVSITAGTTTSPNEPAPAPYTQVVHQYSSGRSDSGPVPGFRRLIREGYSATSALSGEKRTMEIVEGKLAGYNRFGFPGSYSYSHTVYRGDLSGSFSPNGFSANLTNARNMAKMRFNKLCLQELQSLEGQVFLGELGQTLRMIKNPASALRGAFNDYFDTLRRRRRGPRKHREKVLADSYLEWVFGVRPLISDIEGGIQALHRLSQRTDRWKIVRASGFDEVDLSPPPVVQNPGVISYTINRKHTCRVSVRYQGAVNLHMGGREAATSELGLRLDRFVPTLWELIPYSFVADYFTNIGDIISSWALGSSHLRWSFRSERVDTLYEHTVTNMRNNPSVPGAVIYAAEPCSSRGRHVSVFRDPATGSLVPDFRLEIPGMTSLKWLNLAALAQSRKSLTPY